MSDRYRGTVLGLWVLTLVCTAPSCARDAAAARAGVAQDQQQLARRRPAAPRARLRAFISPYSYEWFIRAELLAARGQYAQAVEAYRAALASADDDAYVLARLAEALDRSGDRAGARAALAAALERDPRSEAAWLARGRIAERAGDSAAALSAYERAEAAAPRSPSAPLALAQLLAADGHPERATAVLERFAARSGGAMPSLLRAELELARARGDHPALARAVRHLLDHAGRDSETMRVVVPELLALGDAALAARVLSALPAQRAGDARLRLDTLLALSANEAVEALLATTPPAELGGPLQVADAYLRIGNPERALAALAESARADEREPHLRAVLTAEALLGVGRPADAAQLAASVPPGSAHRQRALASLAAALGASGLPALGREVLARAKAEAAD